MERVGFNSQFGRWRREFNGLAVFACLMLVALPGRAAELKLLVLGDSLSAGYGLKQADAFPSQLEAAMRAAGTAVRVINAGVSGDTTAGGRARLGWSLADTPDAMILELGANDGLRGLDPAQTRANLDAILAEAAKRNLPVLLAGMKAPPNLGREYAAEFEAIYTDLATARGAALYPFFLEGVAAVPALNQADGIHPNGEGVAVIVKRMQGAVADLLRRAGKKKAP